MRSWHVVTGEYPPQHGGVGDYTRSVARGLAASGDRVTIWAPPAPGSDPPEASIAVRRLPDCFGRAALVELDAQLNREPAPRRLLVQYVPQAFGWKGLNVPFCRWLRSRRRDSIWVMFHEVAFPIDRRQPLRQNLVGAITRRMAATVAGAAERAFVSIPAWEPMLRALAGEDLPVEWLPVPSAIPVVEAPDEVAQLRGRICDGRPLVGHFGTYGSSIRPLLEGAIAGLLDTTDCRVLLIGRGSVACAGALERAHPRARGRVHAAGELTARDVSIHLSACDLVVQPYPDGISTRRTSAMAAIAHGIATATTDGWLTEPLWRESGAVALSPAGDAAALAESAATLIRDRGRAARLGGEARRLYAGRFDVSHTIRTLSLAREAARVA